MEIADKGENWGIWWGESVDKELKEKGVCKILHICFDNMTNCGDDL